MTFIPNKKPEKKPFDKTPLVLGALVIFLLLGAVSDTPSADHDTTTTTILVEPDPIILTPPEYKYHAPDYNEDILERKGYTYRGAFPEDIAHEIADNYDSNLVYQYYGQWKVWVIESSLKENPQLSFEEVAYTESGQELSFGFTVMVEVARA